MNVSLLRKHLSANLVETNDDVLDEFVTILKNIYGDSIVAIVFYGSCVRTREYENAVLDFYIIVDSYSNAYQRTWHAFLNKVLPPNVYFVQANISGKLYQAKYAVVSQEDLNNRTSERAFHPYFWARFAQPVASIFIRDQSSRQWLIEIQRQSIQTFIEKVRCMLGQEYTSKELWVQGLQLTYATELRTESSDRANMIFANETSYYDGITSILLVSENFAPYSKQAKILCAFRWKLRNWIGKLLSVFRLLKATLTFSNGIDYIAWKIHRHTGEKIEVTSRLRKYPWLFCWPLLWRLYRSGKIR